MKLCFIDIETTGLDENKDTIWQIAGCIRDNGKILQQFNFINKTREQDLYYRLRDVLNKCVNKFDKDDKMYFIAYNAGFDNKFIRRLFDSNGDKFYGSYFYNPYICIMQMVARALMKKGNRSRPENFKLGTVCKYFKIPVNEKKLHDGNYDVSIMRKLYNKLDKQ